MIARPADTRADGAPDAVAPAGSSMFARTVLDVAAQVEAAETAIKRAILDAARARDHARVIDILTRWESLPACEVLSQASPDSEERP